MYDMKLSTDKKSFITSGNYGYVCAPIGIGDTLDLAYMNCEAFVKKIHMPNMQLRTDIHKSTLKRYQFLETNSWL